MSVVFGKHTRRMTKRVLAVALGAAAFTTAHAQSNVTLYGSVDSGVAYFNNVGGKRLVTTEDGNAIPDMFGLRGTEDLGGGLSALFDLESGFALSTGKLQVAGQLFSRQAMVGLQSSQWGKLTIGHQPSFMFDVLSPYSTGYLSYSFYAFHQGNFDELANTFEFNNSVKYLSPSYGGVTFGAQLGMGNQAGNFAAGRNYAFTAQFKTGGFSIGAVYANENNRYLELSSLVGVQNFLGTGAPTSGLTADKVENWGVGTSFATGDWLLHALFTQSRIRIGAASANASTIDAGASYAVTLSDSVSVGGSAEWFDSARWFTLLVGNTYNLSKRTLLYQQVLYQRAGGANGVAAILGAGQSSSRTQVGATVGIQHWF